MTEHRINTSRLSSYTERLLAGDKVYLSGTVYTARDAAHMKIVKLLDDGQPLPFTLKGSSIYYAGPTPTPQGLAIGSCGPTTASRMDTFAPRLLGLGLTCMIGKGGRSTDVCRAIVENKAVYLCAIGGAGALASKCITSCEVIAFPELGCESVKRLEFKDFPLIVAIDCHGGNLFSKNVN